MFTLAEAESRVVALINQNWSHPDNPLVIIRAQIQTRPWGWLFPWTNRRYLETGDFAYMLGGNAPVAFHRESGTITRFSTGAFDQELAAYEAEQERS